MGKKAVPGLLVQLLAAIVASWGYLCIGMVRGYSSPAVPSMQKLAGHLVETEEIISWVSGIPPLGAFFGGLLAGPVQERIGRRRTLMITGPLFLLGWSTVGFAVNVGMVLSGRILVGFCAGMATPSAQVYVCECTHPKIRGILGSFTGMFMAIGVLMSYLLGAWLEWDKLAFATGGFGALLFLMLLPLPNSPAWLLSRGKEEEAEKSLRWFRSSGDISIELRDMKAQVLPSDDRAASPFSRKVLMQKPIYLPLLLSVALVLFQGLSGIDAIVFYTVHIFRSSDSTLDEHLATIIVGVIQLVATAFSLLIVDRNGRKPLLIASGAIMTVSMAALGTYFYLKSEGRAEGLGFLPLASMMLFMVGFALGYCSIPFLIMGELFPEKQRSVFSGISGAHSLIITFIISKSFPGLYNSIGLHGAFWLYGSFSLLSCFFVYFCLPETKGKTLKEIERSFRRRSVVVDDLGDYDGLMKQSHVNA